MPDILFELRCEELPPRDLPDAARSLETALADALTAAGLPATSTSAAWTPRRIAVWAHGIAERTADREERVNGPKIKAAFDAAGAPTKAAEGFARKVNLPPTELQRDAECVFAVVRTPGRAASQIVAEVLPTLPAKTKWKKTMRWGGPVEFARPIRGVVALLGGDVVACTVAGHAAGRVTRGHPFLATETTREVTLDAASRDEYFAKLRKAFVLADPAERKAAVLTSARKLVNGLAVRQALLEEVTNLVEWPSALIGKFDERFRELPARLLITVMEHHQRFFPVVTCDEVENRFIAIIDRAPDSIETVRRGFERVLLPRLCDARFFIEEDSKVRLDGRLPRLADVVYHRKLGSLLDKTTRLQRLAPEIARTLGHSDDVVQMVHRAATLSKCDLVTLLVGEFPELQGYIGAVYAGSEGEPFEVQMALAEQYRPTWEVPSPFALEMNHQRGVDVTMCLATAECLDIVCQFGTKVGLPTGSQDPFGVRRAAITLLDACERFAPSLDIPAAITAAGGDATTVEYVETRLRQRLRDAGYRFDHIDAVTSWRTAGEFRARLDDLKALSGDASFARLLEVAERCRNITKKADPSTPDVRPQLLVEAAEKSLHAAWSKARATLPAAPKPPSRADVARVSAAIADPLHEFFAKVFVNADDPAIRSNRLALLRDIDGTLLRFADLCKIQKS